MANVLLSTVCQSSFFSNYFVLSSLFPDSSQALRHTLLALRWLKTWKPSDRNSLGFPPPPFSGKGQEPLLLPRGLILSLILVKHFTTNQSNGTN